MRLIDADAVFPWYMEAFMDNGFNPNDVRFSMNDIAGNLMNIPTVNIDLLRAIETIERFYDSCEQSTSTIKTPDGIGLFTDWGYFEEGLQELKRYAEGKDV